MAFGICGLKPDELWHMTPAEATATIKAHIKFQTPAEPLTQRQETEGMSPEQIAERLKLLAGSYGRR